MKTSLSKSQLPIHKFKPADNVNIAKGGQIKRRKSQSNSSRNKEDRSRVAPQMEKESTEINEVKRQQLYAII